MCLSGLQVIDVAQLLVQLCHHLFSSNPGDYELRQKMVQGGALFFLCVFLHRYSPQHGNSTSFNAENTQLITKVSFFVKR